MKLHFRLLRALFPKYAAKHKGFLPGLKNCFMCPPPPCIAVCRSYTVPDILHYFLHPSILALGQWPSAIRRQVPQLYHTMYFTLLSAPLPNLAFYNHSGIVAPGRRVPQMYRALYFALLSAALLHRTLRFASILGVRRTSMCACSGSMSSIATSELD